MYRGSKDGFEANDFHSKCDGQAKTLTVIKSKHNQVFGGFTTQTWDGDEGKEDPKAFVFSITHETKFQINK